jgi:hypothetical protein
MRVMRNGKVRRSLEDWQAICERFSKSGLGQKAFCQQESLAVGSFKKWYRRCTARPAQRAAFVELVTAPTAARRETWALEIELPSGIRVRVRG